MNVWRLIVEHWYDLQIAEEFEGDKTSQEMYDEKIAIASRIFHLLKQVWQK